MNAYGVDSSSPNMSFLPIYASAKSFLTNGQEMFREGEKMAEVLYKLQTGEAVAINPETGKVYTDEEDWFKIAEEIGDTGVSKSADFLGDYTEVDRNERDYSANRASFIYDQMYGGNPSDYLSDEQRSDIAEQIISAIAEKNDISLTQDDLTAAVLSLADLICTSDEDVTAIVLDRLSSTGGGGGAVPASQTD